MTWNYRLVKKHTKNPQSLGGNEYDTYAIHEAFYDTAFDFTNRFFTRLLFDPVGFRNLIVTEHGLLNAAHPDRYKRFIVSGDTSHTALQSTRFYLQDANGVFLSDWTGDFLKRNQKWVDIVEAP